MQLPRKTHKQLALIRESECIGCTKCIQACPVDAIVGAAKQMHTVIIQECIGCRLCVPVCPVDCIDLIHHPDQNHYPVQTKQRFKNRQHRLAQLPNLLSPLNNLSISNKKSFIKAAIQRKQQNRKKNP